MPQILAESDQVQLFDKIMSYRLYFVHSNIIYHVKCITGCLTGKF